MSELEDLGDGTRTPATGRAIDSSGSTSASIGDIPRIAVADDDVEGARIKARCRALLFGAAEASIRLGRLELLERVGAGGMGEVYAARDLELGRKVAVKLVRSDIDAVGSDATARIVREAQVMARLTHPNVVRIYDVGRVDRRVYITMEFVEGTTLKAWLERGPRTWREILAQFLAAGRGLAAAHRTGLVHRDFKPANVLVGDDGRVLVADFGLARALASDPSSSGASTRVTATDAGASNDSTRLVTVQGAVVGTPGYMSPEQMSAAPVDARSDLFSFCVALYEALYGVRPFAGDTAQQLIDAIRAGHLAPPVRRPGSPARLARVLARGLAAAPERRFATMDDLLAALERASRGPWRAAGAAAVVLATAVAAIFVPLSTPDPCAPARAEIDDVWNDARRDGLRVAFAATALPFAEVASKRAGAQLDAYATAWTDARVDACEAHEVRGGQSSQLFDLRVVCLARRKQALATLVDTLAAADPTSVAQAVDATAALPSVDACNDAERLLLHTAREPEATGRQGDVARLRAVLARAEAQRATGHYREGLVLADDAVALADGIDHEPARAEVLALRGRILSQTGGLDEAEAALLDAAELAEANHHDELAADVWLDLVRLANRQLVDPGRGEAWIRRARAAQRRLGDAPRRRAEVLAEQGRLHYLARRHDESERTLRAAISLLRDDGDTLALGKLEHNLANTLEASGRIDEARAAFGRATSLMEAVLGPDHPEFARVVYDLGVFLTVHGDLAEARAHHERALAVVVRAQGPSHHVVGRVRIGLVDVALRSGRFDEAEAHAEEAARVYRESLPDDHRDHVDAALAVGTARFFNGDLEGARAAYTEARDRQRRLTPPDPIALATTVCNLAETLVMLARHDEAGASFSEVERLLADAATVDLDLEARVLTGRGEIALARGDAAAAIAPLERALELRRQLPADPQELARLEQVLATARDEHERSSPPPDRAPLPAPIGIDHGRH